MTDTHTFLSKEAWKNSEGWLDLAAHYEQWQRTTKDWEEQRVFRTEARRCRRLALKASERSMKYGQMEKAKRNALRQCRYIVKYQGQILTEPLSWKDAHDVAISLNAEYEDIDYEVSIAS